MQGVRGRVRSGLHGAKIYVEAYGCSANMADSEMMAGLLQQARLQLTRGVGEADLSLIVTCTVKTPTATRMAHRIRALTGTRTPLIVAGCMPKTERPLIERLNPNASLVGPQSIERIVEAASAALKGRRTVFLGDSGAPKLLLPRVRRNSVVNIIEIASGCLSACSFCQVKLAKKRLVSYSPGLILRDAELAVKGGCRELWLTSTDNGCYGRDIGTDLAELLQRLCGVEGDFYVRVGMMNPTHIGKTLPRLVAAYRHPKVFKFLHIPVQSGSPRILRLMKRGYTVEDFLRIVSRFREAFPRLHLSTDVIAGFPTEDEEDFQMTVKLLKDAQPDTVNLSKFGARPGTKAALMPQLDGRIVKERSAVLHELIKEIRYMSSRRWLGWRGEILVDEEVEGGVVGRNFAYKPVLVKARIPLGSIISTEIVGATPARLVGAPMTPSHH